MPAKWSEGETVNGAVQIPPAAFDCAAWDAAPEPLAGVKPAEQQSRQDVPPQPAP